MDRVYSQNIIQWFKQLTEKGILSQAVKFPGMIFVSQYGVRAG